MLHGTVEGSSSFTGASLRRIIMKQVYRPRFVGHRIAAYAARAAVESWSWRTAFGGLKPWRSMSQVAL